MSVLRCDAPSDRLFPRALISERLSSELPSLGQPTSEIPSSKVLSTEMKEPSDDISVDERVAIAVSFSAIIESEDDAHPERMNRENIYK